VNRFHYVHVVKGPRVNRFHYVHVVKGPRVNRFHYVHVVKTGRAMGAARGGWEPTSEDLPPATHTLCQNEWVRAELVRAPR